MDPNIILIALLAAPVVLLTVLRVNAAQVFLSLCLGAVLVQFVGPDAATIVSSTSAHSKGVPSSQSVVNLVLLMLPVVLTTVFMINSVKGKAKLAYNILPSIGVATLGALLAIPLTSAGLTGSITTLPLWRELENLQTLIISVNTLLCLFFLWVHRPKAGHEGKHGKH